MFNNKQIYWLGSLAIILTFVFVQQQVFAQWTGPTSGPTGSEQLDFLTNPLTETLDLGTQNLTNGGSASFGAVSGTSGTFLGALSSASATVGGNLQVTTINGQTPVFGGGGVKNPLEANLSGADRYGITNLKGCDPAKNSSCAAVSATAGKSSWSDAYAYGVFGQTVALSGNNPSYGVYGLALNNGGVGVVGYSTLANSTGVYGVAKDVNGTAGVFSNQALGGKALVTNGLTQLNGSLAVSGDSDFTGRVNILSSNYGLYVNAFSENSIGISGSGDAVGIFGSSASIGVAGEGNYGGVFNGWRDTALYPPSPGGGGYQPPDIGPISALFGINKTLATVNDAGHIGLVATGGYQYGGGNFSTAGLGLCAISGELTRTSVSDNNYFAYCQDISGTNNYAGFFAGNVYLKNGSIQINDTLAVNNENLIYANASSAVAGSHLLKLQTAGADKFTVDKDGKVTVDTDTFFVDAGNDRVGIGNTAPTTKLTVSLPTTGNVIGDGVRLNRGTGRFLMGQGTSDNTNFAPILSAKPVGNTSFFIRGIQSDTQTTAEAFRFSATNSGENGAMPGNELAMTFYNWATPLMAIMGDGKVGIGTLSPSDLLTVNGSARFMTSVKLEPGNAGPTCNGASAGTMYYFNTNKTLCVCNGSDWDSLVNSRTDNYCSNNLVFGG